MDHSLSHVKGLHAPPLLTETIGQALESAARRWGDQLALISAQQGVRWSWAELDQRAEAVAAGFLALGLERGDRVGIWSPNNAEWAVTQFAAAKAGLILVTINPAFRTSELEYTLNKVGVKALVAAERLKTSDYVAMIEHLAPEIATTAPGQIRAAQLPSLRAVIKIGGAARAGWLSFDEVEGLGRTSHLDEVRRIGAQLSCEDAINIQFTSGTTGPPKGATLSHRNILNNGYFVGRAIGLKAGERVCIPVPLYHCFGMVMGDLACLTHGAVMVYPSASFDPLAVLQTVEAERCAALYGVPTMFIAELSHPEFDRFDLSSLRTGIMAGSPCPVEVMRQVIDRMHMAGVTIAYGMTETSPVSFQTSLDDGLERRVATVGRVLPHLECKIVDADGNTTPRGVAGEFCTKGYAVMLGYWDEPGLTADVVDADGWMHTGDLATIDAEGYGNIVGRIKDMVIRGGENVYPREIEEFLYRHPKVADVAVVGVPDPKYGEELCAWIRLKPGETADAEEVIGFCRGQIAHYKTPRYVRFVDAFPMTVTGKIQKFMIREQMIAELNIEVMQTA
ncbi:MAG TPA: AMP-binding protein [Caulobacteraceae bacterium]|nr:AMP-binding protein [Caulobacteraceae bacterium]